MGSSKHALLELRFRSWCSYTDLTGQQSYVILVNLFILRCSLTVVDQAEHPATFQHA